ncbi:MAG: hypothetical protein ACK528_03440 [Alphaproteobacteria bacterium]
MSDNDAMTMSKIITTLDWQKVRRDRRERIATAAIHGLLANTQWLPKDTTYEQISKYAVRAADALIAELDKEVQP